MDIFLPGTAVKLVIPLNDRYGNQLDVTSVEYRLTDQNGAELVVRTALTDFVAGSAEATIEFLAGVNQLAVGAVSEIRSVELFLNVGGNTVIINSAYVLEVADPLIVGVNSFQSFAGAQHTASQIPNIGGWVAADEKEQIVALIEARRSICRLKFYLVGLASVNARAGGVAEYDLQDLTATEFASLDENFKSALRLAQVVEADAILGGDSVNARRQEGMVLETIGEVKQMFRSSKPLELPVCRRALGYLSRYISFSKGVGRA